MQRKLTITVDETVYEGLHRVIKRGHISEFIESLVRPHVLPREIETAYQQMARDEEREAEGVNVGREEPEGECATSGKLHGKEGKYTEDGKAQHEPPEGAAVVQGKKDKRCRRRGDVGLLGVQPERKEQSC